MFAYSDVILTTVVRGDGVIVIFILGAVAIISFFALKILMEKKRREALQATATQLGLSFSPAKDPALSKRYDMIHGVCTGRNHYAYNIMRGTTADGSPVCFFDHHYEVERRSDGSVKIDHYYFAICTLTLPKSFPELYIEPEDIFHKINQALGFDDIDFESVEFSKRYMVRSPDKKFAYDVCNAQMIDYLLRQEKLTIEIESDVLAIIHEGRMKPDKVIRNYQHLQNIRSLMPDYLFS